VRECILELQIKSYGEMKILGEVWAGRVNVRANQQELTTSTQKEEEGDLRKAL
jgi:hypothetical protein